MIQMTAVIHFDGDIKFVSDIGERVVIRDCALLSDIVCDSLRNDYNSDLSISYCDVCNTDYCNNSGKFVVNWNLLAIIVLLTNVIV